MTRDDFWTDYEYGGAKRHHSSYDMNADRRQRLMFGGNATEDVQALEDVLANTFEP
jgi:hypothetical protein